MVSYGGQYRMILFKNKVRKKRMVLNQNFVEQVKLENRKKHKSKKFYFLIITFIFLVVIGSVISIIGYQNIFKKYSSSMSLAQTGIQHLRTAITLLETLPKNPFDAHVV